VVEKVQIPLDKICVKSGMLCPNCQAKIDKGLYEKWEVDVMKVLIEMEEKFKGMKDVNYKKSIIFDKKLYIMLENLGQHKYEIEKYLREKLSNFGFNKIVLIEYTNNPKELVYKLLHNIEIKTANIYYSPDGNIYYIVKIPSYEKYKVDEIGDSAKRIFKILTNNDIYFEFVESARSTKIINEEEKLNQRIDSDKLNKILKNI
jgi:transcription antitermination factor NusA-like protein